MKGRSEEGGETGRELMLTDLCEEKEEMHGFSSKMRMTLGAT